MRQLIQIKLVGTDKDFPLCQDKTCAFIKSCANHESASTDRVESGLTPDLKEAPDCSSWSCSKQPHNHTGAILRNCSLPYIERWADPSDRSS